MRTADSSLILQTEHSSISCKASTRYYRTPLMARSLPTRMCYRAALKLCRLISTLTHPSRPSRCRNTTQFRSEEHTSELQSQSISYAVFCLKKKNHETIDNVL